VNRPRILITLGDPGGIGPEILGSVLQSEELKAKTEITVIGPARAMEALPAEVRWDNIDLPALRFHKRPHPDNGRIALLTIEEACRRMKNKEADLLVTGPVSKEAIRRCGVPFTGHTGFLGKTFDCTPYMVFFTGAMPIALYSTHLPLKDVAGNLTGEKLSNFIRGLAEAWQRQLGHRPSFLVAGLNPHAGEGGLVGVEEREIIEPAIEDLVRDGIEVEGPFPADSLFLRKAEPGTVGVALYHDQGMIPAKMMSRGRAVNCTLGLPFLRTSPDHGPAFDIAGDGSADPESFRAAIETGMKLLEKRFG